ncbi:MAG: hypothetical protein ACLRVU_08500 [Beduini sp.]|uniref:hypothetical protein n=1 Tax=Beduini sp. TaxID=1922300 RepID=UPI00399F67B5
MHRKNKILFSVIVFGLLFSLGLFNYYDSSIWAKNALFGDYFKVYYIIKILIKTALPILAIFLCHRIESKDQGNQLLLPLTLGGIMILLIASIFFLKIPYTYYWLEGYTIIIAFCLINIYKKISVK